MLGSVVQVHLSPPEYKSRQLARVGGFFVVFSLPRIGQSEARSWQRYRSRYLAKFDIAAKLMSLVH
jgi:hypothetical protein